MTLTPHTEGRACGRFRVGGLRHGLESAMLALLLAAGGCGKQQGPEADAQPPLVEDMSWGKVELVLTADPPVVRYDRDIELSVRMTTPVEIEAPFPFVAGRLEGFVLNGSFEVDPVTAGGKTTREQRLLLTPLLAHEYRIAPMAIRYTDHSIQPPHKGWFATRPIVFAAEPPTKDGADEVRESLEPVWIYPPPLTITLFVVVAMAILAAVAGGVWLVLRLRRSVQEKRMSPRERALRELARLMGRGLIEKDRAKQFYVELTMIVRQYIERQHGVHAPEQTTEEFLGAVAEDTRFSHAVVLKLRGFLEAADLVKFAAYMPDSDAVAESTRTARDYIETDAGQTPGPAVSTSDPREAPED